MSPYEREYFVSRVRSGVYVVKQQGLIFTIRTPFLEDECIANEVFVEAYDKARADDFMTEEEMYSWMEDREIWTNEQEKKLEKHRVDCDDLKVKIFEQKSNKKNQDFFRQNLRNCEASLNNLEAEKNEFLSKTCEGLAAESRALALFERCIYIGNERANLEDVLVHNLFLEHNSMFLREAESREIARNEPWRLIWLFKDQHTLFAQLREGREMSTDQKNLLVWSQMYDNIQESMDCPTENVINDDDALDGWFIVQRRKQESDKAKSELESRTSNPKIANSQELFVVTDNEKEANTIESMNSNHARHTKRQRMATIKRQGGAKDSDFQDRKLEMEAQRTQAFKDKFRR